MKQVFLLSVLIVILYGDVNQSKLSKRDDINIKAITMKKGLSVIINKEEYIVVKLGKKLKVFQNIKGKEKEEVLQKIQEYKDELFFEMMIQNTSFAVGVVQTSRVDLPPCEVFDKDKLELFLLLGLHAPESGELICKQKKDLIDVNSSKGDITEGKK